MMPQANINQLSPRQLDAIRAVANGMSKRQAAQLLSISPETIRGRLYSARKKLGLSSREQLIAAWSKWQVTQSKNNPA